MEEIIQSRLDKSKSKEENIHRLREFLQILILRILHENKHFQRIAFVGGTCLRIIFQLQRFSEDLDFSVTERKGYDFNRMIDSVRLHLDKFGLQVDIKVKAQKTVQSTFIKFSNILQRTNLSRTKGEKLSIRVEVDSNPPSGWKTEISPLQDVFMFPVWHYDLPSLFATKLHTCFFRRFRKGRDYYDLMWYLGRKVQPNYKLLNNAIRQTESKDLNIDHEHFKSFLREHIEGVDFSRLRRDVAPFLINRSEAELMSTEYFSKLVDNF